MPIYEYLCLDCRNTFDVLRPMGDADAPVQCEVCEGQRTSRMISLFFSQSESSPGSASTSACACGGACSCASLN